MASQASEDLFRDDCERCKSKEERGQRLDGDFGDTPCLILAIPLSFADSRKSFAVILGVG